MYRDCDCGCVFLRKA